MYLRKKGTLNMKYFDFAATTPMSEDALLAYMDAATNCYGNAHSLHDEGMKASEVLQFARKTIGDLLHIKRESVIFTSGGTESNSLSILTLLHNASPDRNHIIVSGIEHSSIFHLLQTLELTGKYEIDYVSHNGDGTISLHHLSQLLKVTTALVIVQHANSEIGILQDIEKIKAILGDQAIYLHVDCVQSFGKTAIDHITKVADGISISSHKVFGPKGVGACVFPFISQLQPINPAVSHEFSFRSGTVNVPGVYAFGIAAGHLSKKAERDSQLIWEKRQTIVDYLRLQRIDFEVVEGPRSAQLPHILALLFPKIQGQYVMMELNNLGFSVSTGSACQVGMQEPSKTLLAIGKSADEAKSFIRISIGNPHTHGDCLAFAESLASIIKPMQL